MNILFLDDEQWRHDGMDMMVPAPCTVWHAYSSAWFDHLLQTKGPFDLVCFDHDLGDEKTGLDAARTFVTKHAPTKCLVHSWNSAGAEAIRCVLRQAGHTVIVARFGTAIQALLESLVEAA